MPTPSLAYIAFSICFASFFKLLSFRSHGWQTLFRSGSGDWTIFNMHVLPSAVVKNETRSSIAVFAPGNLISKR